MQGEGNHPEGWKIETGNSPVLAAAIHDGHHVRPDIEALMNISEEQRLREEDPFTANWTKITPDRIIVSRSRFEVDLNRPIDLAVYREPNLSWGLNVYRQLPCPRQTKRTLFNYFNFYSAVFTLLHRKVHQYGRVVIIDLHSYNHRRSGPNAPPADPAENPEVNIGTGTVQNRDQWANVINQFIYDLHSFDFGGRNLDVRENIKFKGGNFAERIHRTFGSSVLVLSVEFKKFFMDEWTGQSFPNQLALIEASLLSTLPNLTKALRPSS